MADASTSGPDFFSEWLARGNVGSFTDMLNAVFAKVATNFVANATSMTVANLIANYPPSASTVGMYARVTDLYGSVDDIMRCRFDGTNYRWVPQRESYVGTTAAQSGAVPIVPLVTPPTFRLTSSSLLANLSFVPSSVNAYIGQRQRIIMPSTINLTLYTAQITGLIGSNVSLLAGNTRDIEYGATGWFQSA